jgi:hypothetical protein
VQRSVIINPHYMAFIEKRLKTTLWLVGIAVLAALMVGCGGGSSSSTKSQTTPLSGLKKRVLLSNQQGGTVTIVDAQKDQLFNKGFNINGANKMVTASGKTVVMQQGFTNIEVIDNATETSAVALQLRDQPFDIAISATDGKTAYAALRNVGEIAVFNTSNGNLLSISGVPLVTRLVEGPNEHKLLAFPDNPNLVAGGGFFVIDTSTNTVTTITNASLKFDQPYTAVFDPADTSDNTFWVLNCGPECGGTGATGTPGPPAMLASVVKVNLNGPVIGTPIPVSGATAAILSSGTLFVAGTPLGSATGTLQAVNTSSLSAGPAIPITNGTHSKMVLASNNRLFIGSRGCATSPGSVANTVTSCLSIFNTSSNAVVIPEVSVFRQSVGVTGIQSISGRSVVYVCQGGELDIYDTTTDKAITPNPPIDIIGIAFDVVQIDP